MNSERGHRKRSARREYPDAGYNHGYGSYEGDPWFYGEDQRHPAERYNVPDPRGATGGEYADYGPQNYTLHDLLYARDDPFRRRENYDGDNGENYPRYARGNRSERYQDRYGVHKGKGPRNYKRSDERIAEEINERPTGDPFVDATEIDVDVRNGEVTLSGMVNDRSERGRAEAIAGTVAGVTHVNTILRLTSAVPSSGRNYF